MQLEQTLGYLEEHEELIFKNMSNLILGKKHIENIAKRTFIWIKNVKILFSTLLPSFQKLTTVHNIEAPWILYKSRQLYLNAWGIYDIFKEDR